MNECVSLCVQVTYAHIPSAMWKPKNLVLLCLNRDIYHAVHMLLEKVLEE